MKGFIIYHPPAEELNYPGGWILLEDTDNIATRGTYELSDDTLEWVLKEGEQISGTKVDFEIKCHCFVSEDEKTIHHRVKGHVKNI